MSTLEVDEAAHIMRSRALIMCKAESPSHMPWHAYEEAFLAVQSPIRDPLNDTILFAPSHLATLKISSFAHGTKAPCITRVLALWSNNYSSFLL